MAHKGQVVPTRPAEELTKSEHGHLRASIDLIAEQAVVRGQLTEINEWGRFLVRRKREAVARLEILDARVRRLRDNADSKSSRSKAVGTVPVLRTGEDVEDNDGSVCAD